MHPYFKLSYIKLAWGGLDEQNADILKGKTDAKNWEFEAELIVDNAVSNELSYEIYRIE